MLRPANRKNVDRVGEFACEFCQIIRKNIFNLRATALVQTYLIQTYREFYLHLEMNLQHKILHSWVLSQCSIKQSRETCKGRTPITRSVVFANKICLLNKLP